MVYLYIFRSCNFVLLQPIGSTFLATCRRDRDQFMHDRCVLIPGQQDVWEEDGGDVGETEGCPAAGKSLVRHSGSAMLRLGVLDTSATKKNRL